MYSKVDAKIIEDLNAIVGGKNILTISCDMEPYSHDETPGLKSLPEAVVKPGSDREISEILRLANDQRIPVTARGGGTGLSGGAVPLFGGIVVSLEKMNRILDIDRYNSMAVVEAGVINGNLQKEVEKYGLFYPVNPASMDTCTIGGNVSEASGGANAVKYGTTRDYVTGIRGILPDGEPFSYGGKILKNATDNNIMHLLIGSEGILGIITEVTLRLVAMPEATVVLIVPFDDMLRMPDAVTKIISAKLVPTMVELMDNRTIKMCEGFLNTELPCNSAAAHMLIRLDGDDPGIVQTMYEKAGEICLENGAQDVLVVDDPSRQREIWKIRQNIHEAMVVKGKLMGDEDVVVPRDKIKDLLVGIKQISEEVFLPIACFGHLGDGNIHVNFLMGDAEPDAAQSRFQRGLDELFRLAVSLGGKISGEHGIGVFKKQYMSLSTCPSFMNTMRKIKSAFDANNILNPGKILG
jgi:glycolate oxidase